jgi:hypothetical protein
MASNIATQAVRRKALEVRAAWEKLPLQRKADVYRALRGQTVGGVEMLAAKELGAWFYSNWATAYQYVTGAESPDLALKAANWLDAVGTAIGESAAKVRDAIHAELLYLALLAGGVLLAYGYANRAR